MIKLTIITIYIACSLICEAASPNYTDDPTIKVLCERKDEAYALW